MPGIVLLEGFPTEKGLSPDSIFRGAKERCSNVESKKCDEGAFAMLLAKSGNIPFEGGEPTEIEIKDGIISKGYQVSDLLGFYVVRQLPQWKREGTLREEGLPGRVNKFIRDYAEIFMEKTDFNFVAFQAWFKNKTKHELDALDITTEDPAPRSGLGKPRSRRRREDHRYQCLNT